MTLEELLFHCLRHFVHLDESNAAIHTKPVKYSPITFRLAERLMMQSEPGHYYNDPTVRTVVEHIGRYEEDSGR